MSRVDELKFRALTPDDDLAEVIEANYCEWRKRWQDPEDDEYVVARDHVSFFMGAIFMVMATRVLDVDDNTYNSPAGKNSGIKGIGLGDFKRVLVKHHLVHADAFDDPDGYDGYATEERALRAFEDLDEIAKMSESAQKET